MNKPDPYAVRGVSSSKEDVHHAIAALPATAAPGAFCQVVTDPFDPDVLQVIHADGAGSKSSVAYLAYKESGDATVFEGIAQDSLAMNIDDMLCVGACDHFLVSNTIGRNAHRVGADVITHLMAGYAKSVEALRRVGVSATLCGGETADLGDLVRTLVVDSTIYAKVPRSRFIDAGNIAPGNVIVGFSSSGKASYEDIENSGIGSNGFTVAKHVLLAAGYGQRFPESYAETIAKEHVYCGPYLLTDALPGSRFTVGQALLSPTRTYAPIVKEICERFSGHITGIIHCTGGGLTKSLKFGTGLRYVKDNLFPLPAIFSAIQACGNIADRDMWKVFNCGHRLEVYCDPDTASAVVQIGAAWGVEAKVIGFVEKSSGENSLTISSKGVVETY